MPGALSAGTVSVGVKPETSGFGSTLAAAIRGETSGIGNLGSEIGKKLLKGMAVIGIAVGVGDFIKQGVEEYAAIDALNAQFEAGIKSTGNAAGLSVKQMDSLASSVAGYSGQSMVSIGKTEQVLQTFSNLRNVGPHKIFDQTTEAAANMAAKLGGDASESAIKLGKALNNPIVGMTSLGRLGVSFTQAQKDQVKQMVETGDVVGAQGIILDQLQMKFGGAALAAGRTLPGELNRAKVAFTELADKVVSGVMPYVTPVIDDISKSLTKAIPWVEKTASVIGKELVQAGKTLQPVLAIVWNVIQSLGGFLMNTIIPALIQFGHWLRDNSKWLGLVATIILGAIVGFKAYSLYLAIIKIATTAWAVAQAILNAIMTANPIMLIVIAVAALVAAIIWVATQTTFFQDAWKVMTQVVANVWNWLWKNVIKPVVDFIIGYFKVLGAVVMWIWTDIFQPVGDFINKAVKAIGDVVGAVFGAIGGVIMGAFNGVVSFVRGIFNTIIDIVNGIIDGVNGATSMAGAIGIHIGAIPHLHKFADSGTILPTPGGTVIRVAEAGRAESVVDTGKLNNLIDAAAAAESHPAKLDATPRPVDLSAKTIAALAAAIVQQSRVSSRMGVA